MNRTSSLTQAVVPVFPLRWPLMLLLAAALVALGAQVRVPLPGTEVPFTLQGPAVLLAGGVFGGAIGSAAMVAYLLAGAFGAPIFAGGQGGLPYLLGPTGGYLLAFPVAALLASRIAERGNLGRSLAAAFFGLLVIQLGGWARLTIQTSDPLRAAEIGVFPFVWVGLAKTAVTGLLLWRTHHLLRISK